MPRKKLPERRAYDTDLSDGQWALIVSIRRAFQLPTSSISADSDANDDVVQAGEAAPHDHVAGRGIAVPGEVAAEHGDLQQVVGEGSPLKSRS